MKGLLRYNVAWPILAGSFLLLCGCMKAGPDYVRPEIAVSSQWLEAKDERVQSAPAQCHAWWEAFGDPVLNQIIERAYHENLTLKIAGIRVLEARAQLGIAVGEIYPQTQQVDGALTFNRTGDRSSQAARGQAGGTQLSYWQDAVHLSAAWEVDFWGKFRRAIESADAGLRASVADYDSALVSLTADAAAAYIQLRTLQRRIDIARQNIATQKESLQIAEARFRAGATSERDVAQARTVLFNTQATLPTLEGQLQQAKNVLSVLLGAPPSESLSQTLQGAGEIPVPPMQVAVGIPADLLRRRPDVRSAELRAMAQSAQIGVAKAELLPAFTLTGSIGFVSNTLGSFALSDIARSSALTAATGPSFRWDILNYGRITNNVRLQDARFQELLISYQNTVLQAQQEVEDSLAGFLRAQENTEYLARSAEAAKRSLDLATVQYQQGSTDFTTVLTSQQSLLTAQDSLASALGSISSNLVGVYRALGGGWEIREGQDLVSPDIKQTMAKRTHWGKLLSPTVYMPRDGGSESPIPPPDW